MLVWGQPRDCAPRRGTSGLAPNTTGVAIGLLLSLTASQLLASVPWGHGFSLPLIVPVPLALLAMAALGAYIPARRASKVDPNIVLRQE